MSGCSIQKRAAQSLKTLAWGRREGNLGGPCLFLTWTSDHGIFCRTTSCPVLSRLTTLKEARAVTGYTLGHAAVALGLK